MKCPYNRKSLVQTFSQSNNLVDEDNGIMRGYGYIMKETYELQDCVLEECGAYHNGRCCYVSINMSNQ